VKTEVPRSRSPKVTWWVLVAATGVWLGATLMLASPQPPATASPVQAVPVAAPVVDPATAFKGDVHQLAGVTCASCHGAGTPGPIERTKIAGLCASCHSDPNYMRKFRPQVRTDQHAQYLTSVHGIQMAKGETRVATCSDCHTSHGVLPVKDARSPVAPSNVANTCARCHADTERMTPFGRDSKVFDDWSHSVHAAGLLERGDTSAPTCSTCHGSHGATPPGIDAVENICSTCHVREAELYHASTKRVAFELAEQPACLTCHSNHKIEHPQDSWIGLEEPALCATCHTEDMAGVKVIQTMRTGFETLNGKFESARAVLERAEHAGMLVDDGMLALREATEQRVRLRVQVHSFAEAPFNESLNHGLAAVDKAQAAGDAALAELSYRRWGLGLATLAILGFLLTLAFKIRSLPPPA
jgi:predicted CXXCH cytochrome family protein